MASSSNRRELVPSLLTSHCSFLASSNLRNAIVESTGDQTQRQPSPTGLFVGQLTPPFTIRADYPEVPVATTVREIDELPAIRSSDGVCTWLVRCVTILASFWLTAGVPVAGICQMAEFIVVRVASTNPDSCTSGSVRESTPYVNCSLAALLTRITRKPGISADRRHRASLRRSEDQTRPVGQPRQPSEIILDDPVRQLRRRCSCEVDGVIEPQSSRVRCGAIDRRRRPARRPFGSPPRCRREPPRLRVPSRLMTTSLTMAPAVWNTAIFCPSRGLMSPPVRAGAMGLTVRQ